MKLAWRILVVGLCLTGCLLALGPPGTLPSGLPKVVAPLTEGTSHWIGKIKTGDQAVDVTVKVDVKATTEGWVISHVVSSPAGDSVDIATLDKQTMESIRREAKQGPMALKLDTKGGKVSGSLTVSGQVRPIDADAGGPLFGDGIAARLAIVCLPLVEGYSTTYRTFDLQQMKPKAVELKVAGSEKVTVSAGSFDTLRVEVRALEGAPEPMTLWMAKESRTLVKMTAVIGPSTVSAELK